MNISTDPAALASFGTESGRRCDSPSQPLADKWHEISPEDLFKRSEEQFITYVLPRHCTGQYSFMLCLHVSMSAEANFPLTPKWIRMNLPWNDKSLLRWCQRSHVWSTLGRTTLTNLEELSFRIVLAFPKASRAGLAWMIWSSRVPCGFDQCQDLSL